MLTDHSFIFFGEIAIQIFYPFLNWIMMIIFFNPRLRMCFDFRERMGRGERERERNIDQLPPTHTLPRELAHNPGIVP